MSLIPEVLQSSSVRQVTQKRYSFGKVVSVGGGEAEVDVGAVLPDGTAQTIRLPLATGFVPTIGQAVAIAYANENVASAYVASVGDRGAVEPPVANQTTLCLTLTVAAVGENSVDTTLQAATKNLSGKRLNVVGVTIFARSVTGTVTADVFEGAASILSAPQSLTAGTVHEPTVSDAVIAAGAQISVRCVTGAGEAIGELTACLWCQAPLP